MIPLEMKSNNYQFGTETLPAVSGSASKDSTGAIHISLTNIDTKLAQEITIDLGGKVFSKSSGQIITSGKLQDYNSFENTDKIKPTPFTGFSIKQGSLVVKLPPFSVVVIELK
jgi:alpha-N-arabinofuranosidase